MLEKGFEFVLNKEGNIIAFDLSLVLLLVEIDFVAEKRSYKKHVFKAYGTNHVEMIFVLLIEVVILYICTLVVQIRVLSFEKSILKSEVCLAILIVLNKQF